MSVLHGEESLQMWEEHLGVANELERRQTVRPPVYVLRSRILCLGRKTEKNEEKLEIKRIGKKHFF